MSLKVFLLCLAAGIAAGGLSGAICILRKKVGIVFTVLTDICIAFISVFAHAVISYLYCDGQLFLYAAGGQILGFICAAALATYLVKKLAAKINKRAKRKRARIA